MSGTKTTSRRPLRAALLTGAAALTMAAAVLSAAPAMAQSSEAPANLEARTTFAIPAQPAGEAINAWSRQSGVRVLFPYDAVADKRARAVEGAMTARQALRRLLADAGLRMVSAENGTVTLVALGERDAAAGNAGSAASYGDEDLTGRSSEGKGVSEILVVGSTSQNVDIRRTEDDPQPYVVFAGEEIQRSGATSLEDFFRKRLPMNAQGQSGSQVNTTNGLGAVEGAVGAGLNQANLSQINLRGIGLSQTLILIDGRRPPRARAFSQQKVFTQSDVNGIPLSAIERIEVLPSTAGGIYGGGAVGGVINIIRKRDYKSVNIDLALEGTFRGGAEALRAQISGGFSPDNGKTQISFSASHYGSRPLYAADNDLWERARGRYFSIPANLAPVLSVPIGYVPNIRAVPTINPALPGCDFATNIWACYSAANLVLDPAFGGTSLGSDHTFVPVGFPGVDPMNPGSASGLLQNAGQYNLDLSNDSSGRRASLIQNPRIRSANINIRREIASWFDIYGDATISDNLGHFRRQQEASFSLLANNPNNPFQQDIVVTLPQTVESDQVSRTRSYAATGGAIVRLGRDWSVTAEYGWGRIRTKAKGTQYPINTTALSTALRTSVAANPLRDVNRFPIDYTPYSLPRPDALDESATIQHLISARASGSLFELPGGEYWRYLLG